MTRDQMLAHLRAADAVAREAAAHGHYSSVPCWSAPRHAETELCRRAAAAYRPDFLWSCTLVSTFDICAMCTGTLYWANIGRLIYGVDESKMLALTGDHAENPTMSLSSRAVFGSGQKRIQVDGPFPEIEEALIEAHRSYWRR